MQILSFFVFVHFFVVFFSFNFC